MANTSVTPGKYENTVASCYTSDCNMTIDEFNKAVNACMGKSLDQVVVDTVFRIFDVDG